MDTTRLSLESTIVTHPFTVNFIQIKAAQLCRRTDFSRSDDDELHQEMLLYLWKKAHLFDSARGNIEAFVTTAINSWVGMELRRRDRLKRRDEFRAVSLEGMIIENDGDATTLSAVLRDADLHRRTLANAPDPIERIELRDAITFAVSQLMPHERELLAHVAERGVASASRNYDVSRRQIENAISRMRSRFEDAGLGGD